MTSPQLLLRKIEALPPERIGDVENFVDSLLDQVKENDRSRASTTKISAQEQTGQTVRKPSIVEFFAASPLANSGVVIERVHDEPRNISL